MYTTLSFESFKLDNHRFICQYWRCQVRYRCCWAVAAPCCLTPPSPSPSPPVCGIEYMNSMIVLTDVDLQAHCRRAIWRSRRRLSRERTSNALLSSPLEISLPRHSFRLMRAISYRRRSAATTGDMDVDDIGTNLLLVSRCALLRSFRVVVVVDDYRRCEWSERRRRRRRRRQHASEDGAGDAPVCVV
jgi:hypothetical protein